MSPAGTGILVNVIVGVGSVLQGAVGFGLGLFAVPFLALIDPRLVPGPILLASGCLTLSMLGRERTAIRRGDLKWSLAGRVVGTVAAMAVLVLVPADQLGLLFGGLVLVAVLLSASGLQLAMTPRSLTGAGMMSGFLGTAVSIGGPPVALLYQRESGPSIRATLSAFFTVGTVLSLTGLHLVGRFGLRELLLGAGLLPGMVVGFLLSRPLAGALDRGAIRPAILVVSGVAAVVLIAKSMGV